MRAAKLALVVVFIIIRSSPLSAAVTAVRCGHLIDVKAGTAIANAVVLVENGEIKVVGADAKVPEGARVIDLHRATCLPGLIDSHTHLLSNLQSGLGDQQG